MAHLPFIDDAPGAMRTDLPTTLHGWYQLYGLVRMGIYGTATGLRMFLDDLCIPVAPSIRVELQEREDDRLLTLRDGQLALLAAPLPPVPAPSRLERLDSMTNPLAYQEDLAEMTAAPHEHSGMAERWHRGFNR